MDTSWTDKLTRSIIRLIHSNKNQESIGGRRLESHPRKLSSLKCEKIEDWNT